MARNASTPKTGSPKMGSKMTFSKKKFFWLKKLLLKAIYSQSFIKIGDVGVTNPIFSPRFVTELPSWEELGGGGGGEFWSGGG